MVYYRKYRPQTIAELDLDTVREKLSAILTSKDLPHAFLFTGPKGLGKTSSARILAKAVNCEKRVASGSANSEKGAKTQELKAKTSIEPCNECQACVSITNGSNIDVLEIDAASNGGVEEIRALRERVKFAPSSLRKKVYIIDEVHMLSTGAFNALLKTLEEPPTHVVFILATTELWKLPATVVSRTFQVQFEKPSSTQMARSLSRIVAGEGIQIDTPVLVKVAEISDGAFRDAAKNLEELVLASSGSKITDELFDKTFRTQGIVTDIKNLLIAYEARDAKDALEIIAKLSDGGADFKIVFERLVDHLRGLLMIRTNIPTEFEDIQGLTIDDIRQLLELSNEAFGELRASIIPQLPLELMTVKFCILHEEKDEVGKIFQPRKVIANENSSVAKVSEAPKVIRPEEVSQEVIKEKAPKKDDDVQEKSTKDLLQQLRVQVDALNKPAGGLLRSCKSAILVGNTVQIVTPFPIHAEKLHSDKVLSDIVKAAGSIVGESVKVKISVG